MAKVLVLGDSDHHVIDVLQRADEDYTDALDEAQRDPGVAFTAIVDIVSLRGLRPEDALVENNQVTLAPVPPGRPRVSSVVDSLAQERLDIELKLADPGVSDADFVSMLHRLEQLRRFQA